jgi:hypothetical protein
MDASNVLHIESSHGPSIIYDHCNLYLASPIWASHKCLRGHV